MGNKGLRMTETLQATKDPLVAVCASYAPLLGKFFRALGDPNRLRLLEFILAGERSVSDCVEHLDLSQGRVSIHLACLADCGFIEPRREGRFKYYSVADPRVADLIMLGRSLTADHCQPISGCARVDQVDGRSG